MQPIQQKSHEFLGIMLCIACELAGLACYNGLDEDAKVLVRNLSTYSQDTSLVLPIPQGGSEHKSPLTWRAERLGEYPSTGPGEAQQSQWPDAHQSPVGYCS